MNKGRRTELAKLKNERRKKLGIIEEGCNVFKQKKNAKCQCSWCMGKRYKKIKHKKWTLVEN